MEKGRKKKVRYIQKMPQVAQFSPRGKPGRPDEIELRVDQFEALKLADYQGLDQSQGAVAMGISRPTFGRLLRDGRRIMVDALVNGKIIRIRIGSVQVGVRPRSLPDVDSEVSDDAAVDGNIRQKILKYSPKIKE